MWPIEPIHYVSHASPAALLFQNGEDDRMVMRTSALRYQDAGSEPKTILWYPAGHSLPFRHLRDQAEWLHERIGIDDPSDPGRSVSLILMRQVAEWIPFVPRLRSLALILDRAMLAWFALVAMSLSFAIWDLPRRSALTVGWRAVWGVCIVLLGPIGVLLYVKSRSGRSAPDATWRPALDIAVRRAVGMAIALAGIAAAAKEAPRLLGGPAAVVTAMVMLPHLLVGILDWLTRIGSGGVRPGLGVRFLRCLTVTNAAAAAAYPTFVVVIVRWLDAWYPSASWSLASPPFWVAVSLATGAGGLASYAAWLLMRGRERDSGIRWTSWLVALLSSGAFIGGIALAMRMA